MFFYFKGKVFKVLNVQKSIYLDPLDPDGDFNAFLYRPRGKVMNKVMTILCFLQPPNAVSGKLRYNHTSLTFIVHLLDTVWGKEPIYFSILKRAYGLSVENTLFEFLLT